MFTEHHKETGNESGQSRRDSSDQRLLIPTRNLAIARLAQADANQLVAAAKPVSLRRGHVLYEEGDEISDIFFPIDCIISALALLEDGSSVEISMIGREGIVGLPAIIGGGRALHWTRASVAGACLRVPKTALERLFADGGGFHDIILRAYRGWLSQVCQRSVCNVRHTLLQRLCTWLLMIQDRLDIDELPFTQEDIASRISVRRAGVSTAASMLQAMHGISYQRAKIVVTDRDVLKHTACECYSVLRRDFDPDSRRGRPDHATSLALSDAKSLVQ